MKYVWMTNKDIISREAVLKQAWTLEYPDGTSKQVISVSDVEKLPSVELRRPHGKWIKDEENMYHCSICGRRLHIDKCKDTNIDYPFLSLWS